MLIFKSVGYTYNGGGDGDIPLKMETTIEFETLFLPLLLLLQEWFFIESHVQQTRDPRETALKTPPRQRERIICSCAQRNSKRNVICRLLKKKTRLRVFATSNCFFIIIFFLTISIRSLVEFKYIYYCN